MFQYIKRPRHFSKSKGMYSHGQTSRPSLKQAVKREKQNIFSLPWRLNIPSSYRGQCLCSLTSSLGSYSQGGMRVWRFSVVCQPAKHMLTVWHVFKIWGYCSAWISVLWSLPSCKVSKQGRGALNLMSTLVKVPNIKYTLTFKDVLWLKLEEEVQLRHFTHRKLNPIFFWHLFVQCG